MMAKVADISASSVQRIWRAHGLQPHRAGAEPVVKLELVPVASCPLMRWSIFVAVYDPQVPATTDDFRLHDRGWWLQPAQVPEAADAD